MIRLLTTVKLTLLQPQIVLAIQVAEAVWQKYGADVLWITSVNDSGHKRDSFHYEGRAVDLRVRHLPKPLWETVRNELSAALGPEFDVILELDPPHVHVEYDPPPLT